MALSKSDRTVIEKARLGGTTDLAIDLSDAACSYLAFLIAQDLRLAKIDPKQPGKIQDFFSTEPDQLAVEGFKFWTLMERLADQVDDVVTYFACLAKLHKARLKYTKILRAQPIATMDQVGPRGLLQYGTLSPPSLSSLLLWRKWLYDIDNRAAQETGYLFEPIIAHSIGGVAFSAKKSPIRRSEDESQGRQVDCVRTIDKRAYEIKLRVTIAASGQGRWREELEFPADCKASKYKPVLIVFDPTPNTKLTELQKAFKDNGGEVFVGKKAWEHLDAQAGATMASFLEKYVRQPLEALLKNAPKRDALPPLNLEMKPGCIHVLIGKEEFVVKRAPLAAAASEPDALPDDVDDSMAGP